jgi:hypothetical protein
MSFVLTRRRYMELEGAIGSATASTVGSLR